MCVKSQVKRASASLLCSCAIILNLSLGIFFVIVYHKSRKKQRGFSPSADDESLKTDNRRVILSKREARVELLRVEVCNAETSNSARKGV